MFPKTSDAGEVRQKIVIWFEWRAPVCAKWYPSSLGAEKMHRLAYRIAEMHSHRYVQLSRPRARRHTHKNNMIKRLPQIKLLCQWSTRLDSMGWEMRTDSGVESIEWKSARDHEIDTDVRSVGRLLARIHLVSQSPSLAGLLFHQWRSKLRKMWTNVSLPGYWVSICWSRPYGNWREANRSPGSERTLNGKKIGDYHRQYSVILLGIWVHTNTWPQSAHYLQNEYERNEIFAFREFARKICAGCENASDRFIENHERTKVVPAIGSIRIRKWFRIMM